MLDKGGTLPGLNGFSSLALRLGNGELIDRDPPRLRELSTVFAVFAGTVGSDFFLKFKGVTARSGLPSPFPSLPLSLLGLLPGLCLKPMLSESCRGGPSFKLVLLDSPLIPGRLNAAAEIFLVVVGVEGCELKADIVCGAGCGDTGVTEGDGGVERFPRYSGGVR